MITCSRRIQFCAGHRVYKHATKCRNLHGHNFVAFLKAEAPDLDNLGMVIDFSVLKEKFGTWIDTNWDHGFLWCAEDKLMLRLVAGLNLVTSFYSEQKMKFFECPFNPTAENMAQYLLNEIGPQLLKDTNVRLVSVRIQETENCEAEAIL